MNKNQVIIIGAGGHAKVVLSTLLSAGHTVKGFVDDRANLVGQLICGYPVIGQLNHLESTSISNPIIFGIGDNKLRKNIYTRLTHLNWIKVIHPQSVVHSSVQIGIGTVIFAGSVIQPDTIIGEHTIVNTATSIDHDCRIDNFVHIAPGTHLAGNVSIGEGAFLGIGCCAIPGVEVGPWSILGAGSVITAKIEAHHYAKGVPAKIYKKIQDTHALFF